MSLHIRGQIFGKLRKVSLHTWGPQPWGTNFTKENGFNHVFLRHFSPRFCSWPKLLHTISEMQIRRDSERSKLLQDRLLTTMIIQVTQLPVMC
jgi:hypothetical protein